MSRAAMAARPSKLPNMHLQQTRLARSDSRRTFQKEMPISWLGNMKLPPWLSILVWIGLGISMIMFNKVMLTTWGFRYPFFLTTWHCILATILTQLLSRTTKLLPGVEKGTVTWKDFFYRMVPMSVFFAMGLVLGNMAYRYISLAYIQMVKAFTPVPLLLLNFAVGKEHPSMLQLCIVLVVSAGVLMSSIGELEFSLLGFVVQMAAVLSDCCRVMIMDLMLRDLQLDSLSLLYYTAPTSAALIFCGFIAMEARDFEPKILTPSLSLALLANGLLAFSLNVAVIYLVSSTSSMVLSISGPIKDITIVLISVCVFGAPITALQVLGFSVSLTGLYLYKEYKSDPQALQGSLLSALTCAPLRHRCCPPKQELPHARGGEARAAEDGEDSGDVELQPFLGSSSRPA